MLRRTAVILLGVGLLGACAGEPRPAPGPDVTLPASLRGTATDPARTAINFVDTVFDRPQRMQGRPAYVAEAVGELEWLAVNLSTDQRWAGLAATVPGQMRAARDELRGVLGIRADATANAVIGAMDATIVALRAGNRAGAVAALDQVTAPGGGARALATLEALPAVPVASRATSNAVNALSQMDGNRGR
jgi:hypothetical protein